MAEGFKAEPASNGHKAAGVCMSFPDRGKALIQPTGTALILQCHFEISLPGEDC